jgi:Histidine kinase-, DNA gyrase B-, and HSP90-like ATPase
MRDLGYGPTEAIADLVDNSVAAGAHSVEITLRFDGGDSWIRIADDGRGMDAEMITEAMRYGAARDYGAEDLGKFGLGLKTASMSQCRCLTVASRTSKSVARVEARQLDLNYIEDHDAWDILIVGAAERSESLIGPLKEHRGTVVLWEDLDRILTYQDPGGGWARRHMINLAERLDAHLGMVFHRFLAGEVPRKKLKITINDVMVDPWDPFARDEPQTEAGRSEDVELNTAAGSGIVHFAPYTLPPKASFSSDPAWRRMSGPHSWNRQQGFYIYRASRLIQSGGWSNMRTADEHTKLARIALLFSPELDAAFGINVAKMRVTLPSELSDRIEASVNRAVKRARTVYDAKPDQARPQRPSEKATNAAAVRGPDSHGNGHVGESTVSGDDHRAVAATITVAQVRREALESAAGAAGEQAALRRIIDALSKEAPEVARDLGF